MTESAIQQQLQQQKMFELQRSQALDQARSNRDPFFSRLFGGLLPPRAKTLPENQQLQMLQGRWHGKTADSMDELFKWRVQSLVKQLERKIIEIRDQDLEEGRVPHQWIAELSCDQSFDREAVVFIGKLKPLPGWKTIVRAQVTIGEYEIERMPMMRSGFDDLFFSRLPYMRQMFFDAMADPLNYVALPKARKTFRWGRFIYYGGNMNGSGYSMGEYNLYECAALELPSKKGDFEGEGAKVLHFRSKMEVSDGDGGVTTKDEITQTMLVCAPNDDAALMRASKCIVEDYKVERLKVYVRPFVVSPA